MAHTYGTKARLPATATTTNANPATFTINCPSGTTVLWLGIVVSGTTARAGGAPTYNSNAMTASVAKTNAGGTPETCAETWYMLAPPTGSAYTISVPNSGVLAMTLIAATGSAPAGGTSAKAANGVATAGSSTNPSTTGPTGVIGDIEFSLVGDGATTWNPTARSGTQLYDWDAGSRGMECAVFALRRDECLDPFMDLRYQLKTGSLKSIASHRRAGCSHRRGWRERERSARAGRIPLRVGRWTRRSTALKRMRRQRKVRLRRGCWISRRSGKGELARRQLRALKADTAFEGVEGTGELGTITAEVGYSAALTGQESLSSPGLLGVEAELSPLGVVTSGAIGDASTSFSLEVLGQGATSELGALAAEFAIVLGGVEGTGGVGTLTPAIVTDVTLELEGRSLTSFAGFVTAAAEYFRELVGVEATGEVGTALSRGRVWRPARWPVRRWADWDAR